MKEFEVRQRKYAAGVLPYCINTNRFLISKRGPHLENEPNKWCIYGGKANIGEGPWETAVREFYEESGVIVPIKLTNEICTKNPDGKYYYNYIGLVEHEFKPIINKMTVDFEIEVTDFKWLTLEELLSFNKNKLHWGLASFLKKHKDLLFELDSKFKK